MFPLIHTIYSDYQRHCLSHRETELSCKQNKVLHHLQVQQARICSTRESTVTTWDIQIPV